MITFPRSNLHDHFKAHSGEYILNFAPLRELAKQGFVTADSIRSQYYKGAMVTTIDDFLDDIE